MLKLITFLGLFALAYSQCGMPAITPIVANCDQNKIVGGCVATPYSWPWQIGFYEGRFGSYSLICGGSVIDSNYIMTAGHCVSGNENQPSKFRIRAGVQDRSQTSEPGEQISDVEAIYLHPNFSMSTISWDISILKLKTPLNFTNHISAVCVPKSDAGVFVEGADSWVTGWGTLHEGDFGLPKPLHQVRVPFLNMSHCDQEYGASAINDACMFCAGRTGEDSCQGDSGGPLVASAAAAGPWMEYGIVSWGFGCAEPGHAGVYSRVSAYCDFIKTTVGKDVCV